MTWGADGASAWPNRGGSARPTRRKKKERFFRATSGARGKRAPREESRWTATEHKASTLRESQANVQCNSVLHCLTYYHTT